MEHLNDYDLNLSSDGPMDHDEDNLWTEGLIPEDQDEPEELWLLIPHQREVMRPDW